MNLPDMMKGSPMDLSEVQDFSMSRSSRGGSNAANLSANSGNQSKSKLNDMLSKLMKKNNVVSFGSHRSV